MVTVICDKTGIKFEAASRRQKNHPRVSSLLNWAANTGKPGAYAVALSLFAECKAEGMTDLAAILEWVKEGVSEFNAASSEAEWQRKQQHKEDERQRRARYKERQYTNGILREGGYRWVNFGFESEEDADFTNFNAVTIGPDWHLYHGDREVTIRQAMQEMAESGNVRAKLWLEEHQ
jgi:hypothetical protein